MQQTGSITNVFYISFAVLGVATLSTFFIPEAARPTPVSEHKQPTFWDQINAYKSIKILFSVKKRQGTKHALPLVALAQFMLAVIAMPPYLLYAMLEFHWTAYEGGYFISLMAFMRLILMLVIFPLCTKLLMGPTEAEQWKFSIWVLRLGCVLEGFGILGVALAGNAQEFLAALIIGSFGILSQPAARTLLTTSVEAEDVGKVLGAVATMDALACKFFFLLLVLYEVH